MMNRVFKYACVAATLVAFVSVCVPAQSAATGSNKRRETSKPKKTDDSRKFYSHPPNVVALAISHRKISSKCGAGEVDCSEKTLIDVATTAVSDIPNDYLYMVSGGKILGSGANVVWDVTNLPADVYQITAAINTSVWGPIGTTHTKSLKIEDCPKCETATNPCAVSVAIRADGDTIGRDEIVKFTATTESSGKLFYRWSISGGKVIGSADGWEILVKVDPKNTGDTITAVVSIVLDPSASCENDVSETVKVERKRHRR